MKKVSMLLAALFFTSAAIAQHTVTMHTLWQRPQVHVLFGDYTVSFTIRDIDKALTYLADAGDTRFPTSCGLDTAGEYTIELNAGEHPEYHNALQTMMQNGVGPYLMSMGHALVENKRHHLVRAVEMDARPPLDGGHRVYIEFYNPKTNARVFSGEMRTELTNKDLGLD